MNEIRPWKVSEPLKAEIEPIAVESATFPEPGPEVWTPSITPMCPSEQRASQRYAAMAGRSWLGWYEGSNLRQTAAWILNISASGCLIAADAPTPGDRSVWLRLDNPAVPDWTEVRVVGEQKTDTGLLALRLVFRGTCPYEMMKAVAFGPAQRPPAPEPARSWSFNSW
jgi:hypothetical protein